MTNYFININFERQWPVLALGFVTRQSGRTFAIVIWPLVIEIGRLQ
jgi:hypothetical protein